MSARDRNKLRHEELINFIINNNPEDQLSKLNGLIDTLNETLNILRNEICTNSTKIVELAVENARITSENKAIVTKLSEMKTQLDRTEQYLRVNNVEIAGLEESSEGNSDEQIALTFFNDLLGVPITKDEIDICHAIPSNRRDKKHVVVCKFISRRSKLNVLAGKEKLRQYNKDNERKTIFLYEHLSPTNRELYAKAGKFKFDNGFKFLWTKNGFPFLRKDENSQVYKVTSLDDLNSIPVS